MSIKHYDVVRAASPSDLAEKLTHKLKEGWQPFGSPVAIAEADGEIEPEERKVLEEIAGVLGLRLENHL